MKLMNCILQPGRRVAALATIAIVSAIGGPSYAQPGAQHSNTRPVPPTQSPDHDVPPAVYDLRGAWGDKAILPLTLRHMDEIFPTRAVTHASKIWELPYAERPLDFSYEFEGKTYQAEAILDRTYTNALVIIKDGRIVYETYRNGSDDEDRFAGFSMSKSITSIMIGCAVEEGRLDINRPVDEYLPELKTGGYAGVTIKQILQMRSGVYRNENYNNLRDQEQIRRGTPNSALRDNLYRYTDAARTIERRWEPGRHYHYMNLDTTVLGWLIERVSLRSISRYATECLWEPLGAESDAYFMMDGPPGVGREFTAAGFNATLRDWARVGLMMLNKGQAKRRVISEEWVKESTTGVPTGDDEPLRPDHPREFAYQWWPVNNSDAVSARGRFGQVIYIDPATNTVIAKAGYVPVDAFTVALPEAERFFEAASAWTP